VKISLVSALSGAQDSLPADFPGILFSNQIHPVQVFLDG
jgi:hypothetical protein